MSGSSFTSQDRHASTSFLSRRFSRRTFLQSTAAAGLSATGAAALLAACGGSSTTDNAANATLTILSENGQLWPVVEQFNTSYPQLNVNMIVSPWGNGGRDLKEKELVLLSSGDTPAIGEMVWMKEFARSGLLADLTDEAKAWDVYPHLTSGQLGRMSYKGRVYGLTLSNNTIFQYYNQDILEQVGMSGPITSWDQISTLSEKILAQKLTAKNGKPVYTTAFDGGNWSTDYWLWAGGGAQMNSDFTQTLIDSPESISAYAYMQNLVKTGSAPKPDGTSLQLWLNGEIALYFSGSWDASATAKSGLHSGVAIMPKGPTGINTTSVGGVEYAIFKNSPHRTQGLSLLKAAASTAFQDNTNTNALGSISDLSAYDNPAKQAVWKSMGAGVLEAQLVTRDQLKTTQYNFLEAPFIYPDASQIYNDALQQILIQLADPATVMHAAAKQINQGISAALSS